MIPVVIGKGIHMFKDIKKEIKFELVKNIDYDSLAELRYKLLK